jgi:hypothetical protein
MDNKPEPSPKWPVWPFAVWGLFFLSIFVSYAFVIDWPAMVSFLLLALAEVGLLVVMPAVAWTRFKTNQRKRGYIALFLPIFFAIVLISGSLAAWAGDIAHFYGVRASLQKQIDQAPGPDKEKLVIFITDGFLSAAYGYVYDGSDEVTLPVDKQSAAWKKRAYMTELEDMCFEASHITGHFYSFSTTHGC